MNDPFVRRWTREDQVRFANLSGDRNPLHLDPIVARRTAAGACAVHGMHLVLWALDVLADAGDIDAGIDGIAVAFRGFVRVDDEVTVRVSRRADGVVRASLVVDGVTAATIDARRGEACANHEEPLPDRAVEIPDVPWDLDWDGLAGTAGTLEIAAPLEREAAAMFPYAGRMLGAERVGALARLSAVVGMLVPGLHSIFASVDLTFATVAEGRLQYRVGDVDARFALVSIDVAGAGLIGQITAFRRPVPTPAPALADVATLVQPGEFAGVSALVVGGSRGLGAVTATALVAGGATVTLTYALGADDARALVAALGGERARTMRYDVREPAAPQLAALDGRFDQLYYFASPTIARPRSGWFSGERFRELCGVYVEAFADLVRALRQRSAEPLGIFYPSTVFAEHPPRELIEYGAAKVAGELVCGHLARCDPGITPIVARLPRLATDQNASVLALDVHAPLPVLLPYVRAMKDSARVADIATSGALDRSSAGTSH